MPTAMRARWKSNLGTEAFKIYFKSKREIGRAHSKITESWHECATWTFRKFPSNLCWVYECLCRSQE